MATVVVAASDDSAVSKGRESINTTYVWATRWGMTLEDNLPSVKPLEMPSQAFLEEHLLVYSDPSG